ncbi:Uu.00g138100.m01.CDS01 [Anthostomella pinea]|uniref:Uu.00g138100.m01.CDS01 n=1 Tax=Anthostomella pinea TaxID=933095 RepID=A0AAI8VQA3_9PEZI|nr:Uu.00g138100.m01.CDS01 [Anthostomella pinea]
MCELHPQKCAACKKVWTAHKKLASCESQDPDARCPESLCMYVGNPRKPVKSECDACRDAREALEDEEEEEAEERGWWRLGRVVGEERGLRG